MKLRNKDTGEVVECEFLYSPDTVIRIKPQGYISEIFYGTLAALCKHWEDA